MRAAALPLSIAVLLSTSCSFLWTGTSPAGSPGQTRPSQPAQVQPALPVAPGAASASGVVLMAPPLPEAPEPTAIAEADEAEADLEAASDPSRPAWTPPDVPRRPYRPAVEQWRPLVRELLAEAWDEGRLDGPAAALDDDLVLAVIQQESEGDPEAYSWAGAIGLMQVMPFTFAEMMTGDRSLAEQIDLPAMVDVASNMRAGIRYLALAMQAHEGNLYWAVASYNAGIEAVDDWRAAGLYAVPPIGGYTETAYYAPTILRNYLRHRPGLQMYVPPMMRDEHVPGAIELLKAAGRW